jgi:hypothetical protein
MEDGRKNLWFKSKDIDGVIHYHLALTAETTRLKSMGQSVKIITEQEIEAAMTVLQLHSKLFDRNKLYAAITWKHSITRDKEDARRNSEATAALRLLLKFYKWRRVHEEQNDERVFQ